MSTTTGLGLLADRVSIALGRVAGRPGRGSPESNDSPIRLDLQSDGPALTGTWTE